jgi:hypothetical protein
MYWIEARNAHSDADSDDLLECSSVEELVDLSHLLEDYSLRYANRDDVLIVLSTIPLLRG